MIDNGSGIREAVDLVRSMIDQGQARAVVGNHELNAVACVGERDTARADLFETTVAAYRGDPAGFNRLMDWIPTLPVWIEESGYRVVHACWDPWMMTRVFGGEPVASLERWARMTTSGTPEQEAIDRLTKGGRILTGDEESGTLNKWAIQWWEEPRNRPWRELVMLKGRTLPEDNMPPLDDFRHFFTPYGPGNRPVFLGHYYMKASVPPAAFGSVACVDFSVANRGYLGAYRWSGERVLDNERFVRVNS
ncbi:MAG: hypothetical protein AAF514_14080 [Verrucomicrobiota bacterium]